MLWPSNVLVAHFIPLFSRLSSSHNALPLRTRILHTVVKSCITHEDSTYTRQVVHYVRGLHIHSSSHALLTRTPHTLVKSCITHEDSTYTRQVLHYERGLHTHTCQVMHYSRGLHIHSSSLALRTRTPHTLVKSCTTNEEFTYTRRVLHYERELHIDSSGHA